MSCVYCEDTHEMFGEPCAACRPSNYHDPHAPTGAPAVYAWAVLLIVLAGVGMALA